MKFWSKALVVLMVAGLSSVAGAADKAEKKDKKPAAGRRGEIASVVVKDETTTIVVTPANKKAEELTVTADAKTEVVVNGKAAKLADLKAGQRVRITPATGTAKKIEVMGKAKADGKPKAGDKADEKKAEKRAERKEARKAAKGK